MFASVCAALLLVLQICMLITCYMRGLILIPRDGSSQAFFKLFFPLADISKGGL